MRKHFIKGGKHETETMKLISQNRRYREAINELRDFVILGENECNLKQLIMARTSGLLEDETQ